MIAYGASEGGAKKCAQQKENKGATLDLTLLERVVGDDDDWSKLWENCGDWLKLQRRAEFV